MGETASGQWIYIVIHNRKEHTMKKVLVLFLFIGFTVPWAKADIIKPTVVNYSEATEDDVLFPSFGPLNIENISGGTLADGAAFEFTLSQNETINSVLSPIAVARGLHGGTPVPGTWPMNLTLYSGSTNQFRGSTLPEGQVIPNVEDPVFSEQFTAVGHDLVPYGS